VKVKLELRNVGGAGLRDLYLFPSDSSLFNLQSEDDGRELNHLSSELLACGNFAES
jgi:hypothetical protein